MTLEPNSTFVICEFAAANGSSSFDAFHTVIGKKLYIEQTCLIKMRKAHTFHNSQNIFHSDVFALVVLYDKLCFRCIISNHISDSSIICFGVMLKDIIYICMC